MAAEKPSIYEHLSKNKPESISTLLEKGANANEFYYTHNGIKTPVLFYAIERGHIEAFDLLLAYGAAVDAKDETGNTALRKAVITNNIQMVTALLENNVDVNVEVWGHGTALHEACRQGNLAAAKALRAKNAKINIVTNEGNTELHEAASYGQPIMMHWLLKQEGIEIDVKNKEGKSPEDYCKKPTFANISIEAAELCRMVLHHKLKKLYEGEEKGFVEKYAKKSSKIEKS